MRLRQSTNKKTGFGTMPPPIFKEGLKMDWTEIIITIVSLVIAPCLITLTKATVKALAAKTKESKLKEVLADVESAVSTAVDSISQTVVSDIKEKSKDGKLTSAEAKQVLSLATTKAETLLSVSTMAYIAENGSAISEYLVDKVEAYIAIKKGI